MSERRLSPLEVAADEAAAHGLSIKTTNAARAFLLGYLIGRQWQESHLGVEENMRAYISRYFGATGRKRKRRAG